MKQYLPLILLGVCFWVTSLLDTIPFVGNLYLFTIYLAYLAFNRSMKQGIVYAFVLGVLLDMTVSDSKFGYMTLLIIAVFCLLSFIKSVVFSESLKTLPFYVYLGSLVFSIGYDLEALFLLDFSFKDLFIMPMIDAFIAYLLILCAQFAKQAYNRYTIWKESSY